jgi:inner membrane protein
MVGPSHAVAALAATAVFARLTGLAPDRAGLLFVLIGALVPDIDGEGAITKPGTMFRRMLPRVLSDFLDAIGQLINVIVKAFTKHRGFFHWPVWPLVMMICGWACGLPWLFWFGFGYFTHILADSLTVEGVPLLAPFRSDSYGLKLFKTGSFGELVTVIILALVAVRLGWGLLPEGYLRGFEEIKAYYRGIHQH